MDASFYSGFAAVAGAAIGGACTVAATMFERRWGRAKRDVRNLADQVAAYYQLEQLYKEELAAITGKAPKTIMEQMRTRVAADEKYVRPCMTSRGALKLRSCWNAE
jgi:hypothetical protein